MSIEGKRRSNPLSCSHKTNSTVGPPSAVSTTAVSQSLHCRQSTSLPISQVRYHTMKLRITITQSTPLPTPLTAVPWLSHSHTPLSCPLLCGISDPRLYASLPPHQALSSTRRGSTAGHTRQRTLPQGGSCHSYIHSCIHSYIHSFQKYLVCLAFQERHPARTPRSNAITERHPKGKPRTCMAFCSGTRN